MVSNSTNINKMNNHISLQLVEHKQGFLVPHMTMENEVLTLNKHKNVAEVLTVNGIPKLFVIKNNMSDDLKMYYFLTLLTVFSMKPQKLSI